jgi:hypothetical protein
MSTHPLTDHEIAHLRHEERLVRAALANAHPTSADGVRAHRNVRRLERLFGAVRAYVGAHRGGAAIRAPRLLS